jgi:hypothetical protein
LLHFFAGLPQGVFAFLQELAGFLQGLSAILPAQGLSFLGTGIQYTGNAASSMTYTSRQNDIIVALNFNRLHSLR